MVRILADTGCVRRGLVICLGLAMAGCISPATQLADSAALERGSECLTAASAICFFTNSPVRLAPEGVRLASRSATFYPTAQRLEFVDGARRKWVADTRTLTDGASIPPIFIPIVGDPRSPEFTNAAAVHDAYCGIGNEGGPAYHADTWQNVHRMFYDTLVVGGTPEIKAKVMDAAVWLGGPRWGVLEGSVATVPDKFKIEAMRGTKGFIEANNPSIPRLITYLHWREGVMRRRAAIDGPGRRQVAPPRQALPPEEPGGPTNPVSPPNPISPPAPVPPAPLGDGASADGVNADGFNADGFNADGFNADGFNADGFNSDGPTGTPLIPPPDSRP